MKPAFTSHQQLREHYQSEMAAMRQSFERTGNGVLCIRRRALVVDCLLEPLWRFESGGPLPAGLALVAVGGFGRKELFPSSDVDLLYLCADERVEDKFRETIRGCNQAMWDLGLRASPMIRTLKECDRYDPDNVEFTLSLLDRRFIAGDHGLYQTLQTQTLPEVALREWSGIVHQTCRPGPRAPSKIRQHHLPSRTQYQGVSGRSARSPTGPLAQPAAPRSRT